MDDSTKNLLARIHALSLANRFLGEQIEEIRKQMESPVVAKFVERRASEFSKRRKDWIVDPSRPERRGAPFGGWAYGDGRRFGDK